MPFEVRETEFYLHLILNDPGSGNAMSLATARELDRLRRKYARWRKPIVVSSALPRLFCAGGNQTDYLKLKTKAEGLRVNREIERLLGRFAAWPVVKLAVVEGDALGGGVEWLSCFDFRWSTPSAFLIFWQRRVGLSSGWGGGARWASRVGENRVRQLLLESRLLCAEDALSLDLLDRVIVPWRMWSEVERWCASMASETVSPLVRWSARDERKIFSSLWYGRLHREILARWHKR
jgi:enoyl-CoA hydratase/carnithine racemase